MHFYAKKLTFKLKVLKSEISSDSELEYILSSDKVRRYEMMMNTVRNSIYYLLYINPNMYK